jgi:hypothetical protein
MEVVRTGAPARASDMADYLVGNVWSETEPLQPRRDRPPEVVHTPPLRLVSTFGF